MTEQITKTPHSHAVYTDLRMLKNAEIFYCAKVGHFMRGTLVRLSFDRTDKVVKGSMNCIDYHFGPNWRFDDKPYGKNKIGHWYFADPSENTRVFMHNLGYEMTEEDMAPTYGELRELAPPPDPAVADLVTRLLDKPKEENDRDSAAGSAQVAHTAAKHHKAGAAKAG